MIVITDNQHYAENTLGRDINWSHDRLPSGTSVEILSRRIFQKDKLYVGEIHYPGGWEYIFITEFSKKSQYDILIESVRKGLKPPDKLLCFAGAGKKFHGFKNRSWIAEPGNIHLSVYHSPNIAIDNFPAVFLALPAVSVAQTLDLIPELRNKSGIKWVNDILIENAKISGVLAHTQSSGKIITGATLGIGLNVETVPEVIRDAFVPDIKTINNFLPNTSALKIADILPILTAKLSENYNLLLRGKCAQIIAEYQKRSIVIGKTVRVFSDSDVDYSTLIAKGKVANLTDNLELVVDGYPQPIHQGRIVYTIEK
ncbi:MAG: hypothetical protein H8E64_07070 [Candidatus Marinimicrobia bacterium]|nr:hypothetical protein [Candidatus Neomarinimicrobiota bacterium]